MFNIMVGILCALFSILACAMLMLYRNKWTCDFLLGVLYLYDEETFKKIGGVDSYDRIMWSVWKWSRNPSDWVKK